MRRSEAASPRATRRRENAAARCTMLVLGCATLSPPRACRPSQLSRIQVQKEVLARTSAAPPTRRSRVSTPQPRLSTTPPAGGRPPPAGPRSPPSHLDSATIRWAVRAAARPGSTPGVGHRGDGPAATGAQVFRVLADPPASGPSTCCGARSAARATSQRRRPLPTGPISRRRPFQRTATLNAPGSGHAGQHQDP